MARIIWTTSAADDLEEIASFIALDKRDAAVQLVQRILDSIERLEDFPFMGRVVPETAGEGYRELDRAAIPGDLHALFGSGHRSTNHSK